MFLPKCAYILPLSLNAFLYVPSEFLHVLRRSSIGAQLCWCSIVHWWQQSHTWNVPSIFKGIGRERPGSLCCTYYWGRAEHIFFQTTPQTLTTKHYHILFRFWSHVMSVWSRCRNSGPLLSSSWRRLCRRNSGGNTCAKHPSKEFNLASCATYRVYHAQCNQEQAPFRVMQFFVQCRRWYSILYVYAKAQKWLDSKHVRKQTHCGVITLFCFYVSVFSFC